MEVVKVSILSVLISLSGWMNDGLKSYEAKKYDEAIKSFTKVIKKDVPYNRYRDVALFYRAKSYEAKKDKKKALADLLVLIQKHPSSSLSKESLALYKKLGGDQKKILPSDSPKKVWEKFLVAAKEGDAKTALKISTGIWEKMVKARGDRFGKHFSLDRITLGKEEIGKGEKEGTATIELNMPHGGPKPVKMNFILDKKSNTWLIAGFEGMEKSRAKALSISNMNNLKQIGLSCRIYSNDYNEKFPPNLNALKTEGYLENETVYLWTNSKTNKTFPFIYSPGHNEAGSVDTMLAAAPMAVNGKREVLWLDGHVKTISEAEFIKNAKGQKWKLKGVMKKKDVPAEAKKRVLALIAKLADKDFGVRKKAKEELKKIGDNAYPFLEENQNHKDPEVKMTIKEILEGK